MAPVLQFAAIVFGPAETSDRQSVTFPRGGPEILKSPLEIFSVPAPAAEGQVKRNLIDLRVKLHAAPRIPFSWHKPRRPVSPRWFPRYVRRLEKTHGDPLEIESPLN